MFYWPSTSTQSTHQHPTTDSFNRRAYIRACYLLSRQLQQLSRFLKKKKEIKKKNFHFCCFCRLIRPDLITNEYPSETISSNLQETNLCLVQLIIIHTSAHFGAVLAAFNWRSHATSHKTKTRRRRRR